MERLSAAFEFPLSENRQQYERLLFPQEYADVYQRGETVLKRLILKSKMLKQCNKGRLKNQRKWFSDDLFLFMSIKRTVLG